MSISTQKEILELDKNYSNFKRGCGNGLVVRKMNTKKGGIYFKGVYYSKITGKQQECHIGTFGKNAGEYTLKRAHQKWNEIKEWAIANERECGDFMREKKNQIKSQHTLSEAVEEFLKVKRNKIKETTFVEYKKKLENQVMSVIPPDTPLKQLQWNQGGRQRVMNAIAEIHSDEKYDQANRCQNLLKQVFNWALSRGWMDEGRNPADRLKGDESPEASVKHHDYLDWKDVPTLCSDIDLNRPNANIQSVMATKLLLMTFLRTGALTRLEWDWFNTDFEYTITIPGNTSGLKRKKGKNDDIPHHVPITPQMERLFTFLRELNGETKYVFQPLRDSLFPHLDPSTPNNFLRSLGYGEKLQAHGWRSTALTTGIDLLRFDRDVIKKQLGHLPEGKVNQAYDKSLRLDERRDFMNKWCDLLEEAGLKI